MPGKKKPACTPGLEVVAAKADSPQDDMKHMPYFKGCF
jgi:hypothetical protein